MERTLRTKTWVEAVSPMAQLVKNLPAMQETGAVGLIPVLGRSPGEGNDNPLQYSCLENSMDKGARQATILEVTKELDTTTNV